MAQFAGSRSLDERRRRRIAGNLEEDAAASPPAARELHHDSPASAGNYTRGSRRRLPLQRIIPARLWKHVLVGTLVLAAGLGIFELERRSQSVAESLGPSAGEFVSAGSGRLLSFFCGAILVASAELALLIWWVRSRSRTDFSGRFHIWRWGAAAGFLLAATVMLDAHVVWSRTLIWRLQLDFAHAETLCWLAPAVGCGSVLLRDLLADIRDCRSSTTFLWLAVSSWGASIGLRLGGGELIADSAREELTIRAAATFGYYCLFVSTLLQARFVLFVSAEPPAQRQTLAQRTFAFLVRAAVYPARAGVRIVRRKRSMAEHAGDARFKPPRASIDSGIVQPAPTRRVSEGPVRPSAPLADASGYFSGSAEKRTLRFDEPHELAEVAGLEKRKSGGSRKQKRSRSRASN